MYIEYKQERNCKKCKQTKLIEQFCDMVNLSKGYECKECRSLYINAYYLANKQRIRDNEKIRRGRAKELKTENHGNI